MVLVYSVLLCRPTDFGHQLCISICLLATLQKRCQIRSGGSRGRGGGGVGNPSFRKLFSEPRAKWLKYLYLTLNMYVLAGIGWGDYEIMQCLKLEFIIFEANWNPTAATLFKFLDLLLGTAAFDIKVKNYSIIIVLFVDKTAHLKLVSRSDAVGRISTLQISTCINMLVWWNILKMISL